MSENVTNLVIFGGLIGAAFLSEMAFRLIKGRQIKEWIDRRIVEIEENIKNWEMWIDRVIESTLKIQHVIDIHFKVKKNKEEVLKCAKHYRVLRG